MRHIVRASGHALVVSLIAGCASATSGMPSVATGATGADLAAVRSVAVPSAESGAEPAFETAAAQAAGEGSAIAPPAGPRESAAVTVAPIPADAIVDSIGLDSGFDSRKSPEATHLAVEEPLLFALGIRHLREGNPRSTVSLFRTFGQHGIRHSIGYDPSATTATIVDSLVALAPYVDFVEGPNELDIRPNLAWVPLDRSTQRSIWSTVRGQSRWNGITVLAPALGSTHDFSVLGAVPADASNIHNGTCDLNPATTARSVALPNLLALAHIEVPGKPVWTTETGYDTNPNSTCYISQAGAAKYLPRTLLYRYAHGSNRNYLDFWSDKADDRGFAFSKLGLVEVDGTPKAGYFALKSMIAELADPGPAFATRPLTVRLGGWFDNVEHLLLQKRNGAYEMVLWDEVPSWDHVKKIPLVVAPKPIAFSFGTRISHVRAVTYDASWALRSTPVTPNATGFAVRAMDALTFVTFTMP